MATFNSVSTTPSSATMAQTTTPTIPTISLLKQKWRILTPAGG